MLPAAARVREGVRHGLQGGGGRGAPLEILEPKAFKRPRDVGGQLYSNE